MVVLVCFIDSNLTGIVSFSNKQKSKVKQQIKVMSTSHKLLSLFFLIISLFLLLQVYLNKNSSSNLVFFATIENSPPEIQGLEDLDLQSSLFVNFAASSLSLQGCVYLEPPGDALKLDPTPCSLFCMSRNFKFTNIAINHSCFCSNRTEGIFACSDFDFNNSTYLTYKISSRSVPNLQNDSLGLLGCLRASYDLGKLEMGWENEEASVNNCLDFCYTLQKPIAVMIQSKCFCDQHLTNMFELIDEAQRNPIKCKKDSGQVYFTKWATSLCAFMSYQDKNSPKIPKVGLVSVPGSGNTWTRSLLQQLTGVFSGSIYGDTDLFDQKLYGEIEPWKSDRISLVKNHLSRKLSEKERSNYFNTMRKFIIVVRNPLRSSLAEFNRREFGHMGAFESESSFLKVARKRNKFKNLFRNQLTQSLSIVTSVTSLRKPVLVLSYEDFTQSLLTQLLRVARFVGMNENEAIERAVCTILRGNEQTQLTKRASRVDLTPAALTLISRTEAREFIYEADRTLARMGLHRLRVQDYLNSLEDVKNEARTSSRGEHGKRER